MAEKWIAKATSKNKGALRATARREGLVKGDAPLTMTAVRSLEKSKNPKTRKRARLAQTLMSMHRGG